MIDSVLGKQLVLCITPMYYRGGVTSKVVMMHVHSDVIVLIKRPWLGKLGNLEVEDIERRRLRRQSSSRIHDSYDLYPYNFTIIIELVVFVQPESSFVFVTLIMSS